MENFALAQIHMFHAQEMRLPANIRRAVATWLHCFEDSRRYSDGKIYYSDIDDDDKQGVYDEKTGKWEIVPVNTDNTLTLTNEGMHVKRHDHAICTLPNGNIFVVGGRSDTTTLHVYSAEIYDLLTKKWTRIPHVLASGKGLVNAHCIALTNTDIILIGGTDENTYYINDDFRLIQLNSKHPICKLPLLDKDMNDVYRNPVGNEYTVTGENSFACVCESHMGPDFFYLCMFELSKDKKYIIGKGSKTIEGETCTKRKIIQTTDKRLLVVECNTNENDNKCKMYNPATQQFEDADVLKLSFPQPNLHKKFKFTCQD
jgi:hypothetical protein